MLSKVNTADLTLLACNKAFLRVMGRNGERPMDSPQVVLGVNSVNGKPVHLCPNCNAYKIAATWSERVSDRCIRNVWSCDVCGCEFETSAVFSDATCPSN